MSAQRGGFEVRGRLCFLPLPLRRNLLSLLDPPHGSGLVWQRLRARPIGAHFLLEWTFSSVLLWKVRSSGLQSPEAAALPPTSSSSMCLPSDSLMPCSMLALLSAAQAFVCAVAFEMGHEAVCSTVLLLELLTMACGSLGVAAAMRRPLARRARSDRAAWPLPARIWPTGRHREPRGGPSAPKPMRFGVGCVVRRL